MLFDWQSKIQALDLQLALGPLLSGEFQVSSLELIAPVIELERLPDVIYVGRPVQGQEHSTVGLFKIIDGGLAVRVPVTFGRASVTTIEVVKGLEPGDEVVMSDMSSYEENDKLKLK